jgi:hypothetical protein
MRSQRSIFHSITLILAVLLVFIGSAVLIPESHGVTPAGSCSSNGQDSTSQLGNGDIVEKFTLISESAGDATCSFSVPNNIFAVDYLVVAGGGGGASGGGGGGGVVTSWNTEWHDGTQANAQSSPLSVTPGNTISITVGARGTYGWGGSNRCAFDNRSGQYSTNYGGCSAGTPNPSFTWSYITPTNGHSSIFGSVTAVGGGAGGGAGTAGNSGGSGGGASYDVATSAASSSQSSVVGANSFGNDGAGNTCPTPPLSCGYTAGAGGGGAGQSISVDSNSNGGKGANSRIIIYDGGNYGNGSVTHSSGTKGGGGNGGAGIKTDISGGYLEYGCGGGGGVNNNSGATIPGGGGAAGCSGGGAGSDFGTFVSNRGNHFTGGDGTPGTGGGGGGTDPEDIVAGNGGSGVVIIRYTPVNVNCPYSATAQVTTPIACPVSLTINADGSSTTRNVASGGVSYSTSANSPTISLLTSVSGLTASSSGQNVTLSAPSGSSLVGGTYPISYQITEGSNVSKSYLLITVNDPTQYSPITIPIDPRATSVPLPPVQLGAAAQVLLCIVAQADSYANQEIPTFTGSTTGLTYATVTGGFTLTGSNAAVQAQMNNIVINKNPSDTALLPGASARTILTNVSNTTNGGNGSCTYGTQHRVDIVPYGLIRTIVQNTMDLGHHR